MEVPSPSSDIRLPLKRQIPVCSRFSLHAHFLFSVLSVPSEPSVLLWWHSSLSLTGLCPASAANGYGEMESLACAVNPVEGEDEKNGAKQSEQQVG